MLWCREGGQQVDDESKWLESNSGKCFGTGMVESMLMMNPKIWQVTQVDVVVQGGWRAC